MGDLQSFLHAVVDDHVAAVARALAACPELASQASPVGATRQVSKPFFLSKIAHYQYQGDTALHLAAAGHLVSMVELLLRAGANVDATNRRGATPLHYACDGGPLMPGWNARAQADTIGLLFRAGAKVDARDSNGTCPLHRAVRNRCALAVKALLKAGADPAKRNKSGSTPLKLAGMATGRGGSGSMEARREQAAIMKLLG